MLHWFWYVMFHLLQLTLGGISDLHGWHWISVHGLPAHGSALNSTDLRVFPTLSVIFTYVLQTALSLISTFLMDLLSCPEWVLGKDRTAIVFLRSSGPLACLYTLCCDIFSPSLLGFWWNHATLLLLSLISFWSLLLGQVKFLCLCLLF